MQADQNCVFTTAISVIERTTWLVKLRQMQYFSGDYDCENKKTIKQVNFELFKKMYAFLKEYPVYFYINRLSICTLDLLNFLSLR